MAPHARTFSTVLVAIQLLGSFFLAGAARAQSAPLLTPIYRIPLTNGGQRLVTATQLKLQKLQARPVAFYAVVTNDWLAGLAPLFVVERTNRFELRRRPPRGQENFTEPLFFALPPEDEPHAARLIGRWDCKATREGSKPYVGIELTIEGEHIAGRFDQNTDYRFAFITGGSFKSNRVELRIEYIKEVYVMTGDWRDGKLSGQWRQIEDAENGTWEASRLHTSLPQSKDTVALYEWRRAKDGALAYAVEGERLEPPWQRAARPLCRVWHSHSRLE